MVRDAITGAFGFTGRAIAARLIEDGHDVVTLSRRPRSDDASAATIAVRPLDFSRPADLADSLAGVDTLYQTYWMRFRRAERSWDRVVTESGLLLDAAGQAGVRRIVHVSVVNASPTGPTAYFRAKAEVESRVRKAGPEWAIVRPTLTYGQGDILINNLAWALRRLPVYGLPGRGEYTVQPVHVDDVARICVEAASGPAGATIDAAGPEILRYRDLVDLVRDAVHSRAIVVPMPSWVVLGAARVLGVLVRDVVLTRDEVVELTSSLLTSAEQPRGQIRCSEWVAGNADVLGRRWSSELARNYGGRPSLV